MDTPRDAPNSTLREMAVSSALKQLQSRDMNDADDHSWDLRENDDGNLPASDDAFGKKMEEWAARDWTKWLSQQLRFPFLVTREEDDDDAYFLKGAAKAPFRLGHTMEVLAVEEDDIDRGIMVRVLEKNRIGTVPLSDLQVTPKSDANFWPAREYVVWYANRF